MARRTSEITETCDAPVPPPTNSQKQHIEVLLLLVGGLFLTDLGKKTCSNDKSEHDHGIVGVVLQNAVVE